VPKSLRLRNVPGGIRTPNLLIRSQKLYPVELQALLNFRFSISDLRLDTEVINFSL
jgi:hypothetical protein